MKKQKEDEVKGEEIAQENQKVVNRKKTKEVTNNKTEMENENEVMNNKAEMMNCENEVMNNEAEMESVEADMENNKQVTNMKSKGEKEMKKAEKKTAKKTVKEVCKKVYETFRDNDGVMSLVGMAALVIYMILGGDEAGATMAVAAVAVVTGSAGGKHVMNGPLTTAITEEQSPDLLLSEIDRRIVKVRPMSTPLDQISRWGEARQAGSMKAEYYAVDTKGTEAKTTKAVNATTTNNRARIETDDDTIFTATETLLVPEVNATDVNGATTGPLVLYVTSTEGGLMAMAANNWNGANQGIPAIPAGSKIVRMGRAATELDVQTPQYSALPVKAYNYCQIFKAQVEQSTFMKIANKETGWTFSDQEEVAIVDMRMGMEKNFLFGARSRFTDPNKREDIFLTGGIWNQAGREWSYDGGKLELSDLVGLARMAFTKNAGSSRKVLIGGSGLIERLHDLGATKVLGATEVVTQWGLDFTQIHTKFGTLYVVMSETFDHCGHTDEGMVIDPEYLVKYTHVPFHTEKLDLRTSGQRNTEAVVITEASCIVLRYPDAHLRIKKTGNVTA